MCNEFEEFLRAAGAWLSTGSLRVLPRRAVVDEVLPEQPMLPVCQGPRSWPPGQESGPYPPSGQAGRGHPDAQSECSLPHAVSRVRLLMSIGIAVGSQAGQSQPNPLPRGGQATRSGWMNRNTSTTSRPAAAAAAESHRLH